jgi:hypothetical protein
MSLDPLNGMTNTGYSFNSDNPFGYSDPTGMLLCGGAGPFHSRGDRPVTWGVAARLA